MTHVVCEHLFRDYRHAYQKWLDDTATYNQEEHGTSFDKSQFIEWEGKPYNCLKNSTKWSCATFGDGKHQKAKCQQLYMGRPHLHAPCDPGSTSYGEKLTQEYCEEKGYLTHNGLDKQLESLVSGGSTQAPKLTLPPITCEQCRSEFETLAQDFSYQNLSKVAQCVQSVKHTTVPPTTTPPTTTPPTTDPQTTIRPTTTQPPAENVPPPQEDQARLQQVLRTGEPPLVDEAPEKDGQSLYDHLKPHYKLIIGILLGLAFLCVVMAPPKRSSLVYGVPNNGLVSYKTQFSNLHSMQQPLI